MFDAANIRKVFDTQKKKPIKFRKKPGKSLIIQKNAVSLQANIHHLIKSIWKQQKEKGHAKRFVQHSRNPYAERKNGLKRVTLFLSEFNNNGWQSRSNESLQPLNLKHYEQAQFEKHQPPSTLHSA